MAEGWRLYGFTFMTGRGGLSALVFRMYSFLDRFDLIPSGSVHHLFLIVSVLLLIC